jgi:hypothetical protein
VPELQEVIRHHGAGFLVAHGDVATAARTEAVHEDAGGQARMRTPRRRIRAVLQLARDVDDPLSRLR